MLKGTIEKEGDKKDHPCVMREIKFLMHSAENDNADS